jgi:hypothetical protein
LIGGLDLCNPGQFFIVEFLVAPIGLGVSIDYSLLVVTRWRGQTFGRRGRSWRRGAVTARFLPFDMRQFPADAGSYRVGHVPCPEPVPSAGDAGRKSGPINILSVCAAYGTMVLIWRSGLRQQSRVGHPGHRFYYGLGPHNGFRFLVRPFHGLRGVHPVAHTGGL